MEPQPNPTEARVLIQRREWQRLRDMMDAFPATDVADLLMRLHKFERVLLFRALSRPHASDAFAHLMREEQDTLLTELTDAETRDLVATMAPDDRAALLGELPSQILRRLLSLLDPAEIEQARDILGYPPGSAGHLMSPLYLAVDPESRVEEVLAYVRHFGRDSAALDRIFVVDGTGELTGEIPLRQLILAAPERFAHEIADPAVVNVPAFHGREEALRLMERYDLTALPVTDSNDHLVGIVTFDDLVGPASAEHGRSNHRLAALQVSGDEAAPSLAWLTGPQLQELRQRFPGLMTLAAAVLLVILLVCIVA